MIYAYGVRLIRLLLLLLPSTLLRANLHIGLQPGPETAGGTATARIPIGPGLAAHLRKCIKGN